MKISPTLEDLIGDESKRRIVDKSTDGLIKPINIFEEQQAQRVEFELSDLIKAKKSKSKIKDPIYVKNSGMQDQSFFSSLATVIRYTFQDSRKNFRSFKIGVTSILLVVAFVTFLKSMVDIAPIALLRASINTSGAFDFQIGASTEYVKNDDVNQYEIDPFSY